MAEMVANTEPAILSRVIEPERADLAPELARYVLQLDFRPADHERMEELAARATAGSLTADEQVEVENYRHVGHLLALMQSKARLSLKKAGLPA
jgi:hypothetical protein